MSMVPTLSTEAIDTARETLYLFFAMVLRPPIQCAAQLRDESVLATVRAAADLLRQEALNDPVALAYGEEGPESLDFTAAGVWWEMPLDDVFAEYDRVFGMGSGDCYETEFSANREPFFRAQQMADVAGFYRAFGLKETKDRPDHLTIELEFMAFLIAKERMAQDSGDPSRADERREVCRSAQAEFLRDHLVWWVPSFVKRLRQKAVVGPYTDICAAMAALMPIERSRFNLKAPAMPARPQPTDQPGPEEGCGSCPSAT